MGIVKKYAVTEIFGTLQGEGANAGRAAIFVRFSGCNLWSGKEEHRQRDWERNRASCPSWCDTDFLPREKLSRDELVARISKADVARDPLGRPLVVLTGGEPGLQIDAALLAELRAAAFDVSIETNGTIDLGDEILDNAFVCMSPKVEPDRIKLRRADEVKLVFPEYHPAKFFSALGGLGFASRWWIQPVDLSATKQGDLVSLRAKNASVLASAVSFVRENPVFRLSLQTHKMIGIP